MAQSAASDVYIDSDACVQILRKLQVSEHAIASTTIEIDVLNRWNIRGSTMPKRLDRWLHGPSEHNKGSGLYVRVASKYRGRYRSATAMNQTLVHELEHVAQISRHDIRQAGLITMLIAIVAGTVTGWKISHDRSVATRLMISFIGFVIGLSVGYFTAPHEVQARSRARYVRSKAITIR